MRTALILLALFAGQLHGATPDLSGPVNLRWLDFVQSFCRGAEEIDLGSTLVRGTLAFENRSRRDVFLLRQPHTRGTIRLLAVNPDLQGKSAYTFSAPLVVGPNVIGSDAHEVQHYTKDDFVRLRPKETYTELWSFGFPFPKLGNTNREKLGLPLDGDYWASVQIGVWHDSVDEASRIGRTLGKVQVWTKSLWSEPIRIQVRSDAPAQACH